MGGCGGGGDKATHLPLGPTTSYLGAQTGTLTFRENCIWSVSGVIAVLRNAHSRSALLEKKRKEKGTNVCNLAEMYQCECMAESGLV